jgi:biopolymer transport protein ExbB
MPVAEAFPNAVVSVWLAGGWIMLPLALLAIFVYGFGLQLLFYLQAKPFRQHSSPSLARWVEHPEAARGDVGEMIRYGTDDVTSLADIHNRFAEIQLAEIPRIDRRLTFLTVLVTAAPLTGLLGTVFGMLATFQGLAGGAGAVIDRVASGISEALITTEFGLLIAIPGYFLIHAIRRRRNQYEAFLARLESLVMQRFRREEGAPTS